MRKKLFLAVLLLFVSGLTYGQIRRSDHGSVMVNKRVSLGVKGGVNICKMIYTDGNVNVPQDFSLKPAMGIYAEIPVRRFMSVSPEFMYIQRGTHSNYTWTEKMFVVDYKMNVRYIDLRVPIQFYWLIANWLKPYAFVGPDFGYVLGGSVEQRIENPEPYMAAYTSVAIGSATHSPFDVSVFGGIGCRFDINLSKTKLYVKLEGAYNHGLFNTFGPKEIDESASPAFINGFNNTGYRFNRGIEVMLSVAVPLYIKEESCSYFESPRRW